MNRKDINNLIRWSVDVGMVRFAEDAYGITGTPYERFDDYIKGKYRLMHDNFIMWVASLDDGHRERLARSINNNPTNEPVANIKEHKEKYKELYKDINNILGDMVAVGSKNQRKGE